VIVTVRFILLLTPVVHGQTLSAPPIADDLDRDSLRAAVRQSISYLEKLSPELVVGAQPRRFTAGEVLSSLLFFDKLIDRESCRDCWTKEIEEQFELIPSADDPGATEVQFTGYYQPVIDAELVSTAQFAHPIYRVPDDMIVGEQVTLTPRVVKESIVGRFESDRLVPYYSRREIDELGVLRGRGYEIAWAKDPIDLFFLHIQGSGVLRLRDGRRLNISYAGGNGRPYRSIARFLIDAGKISQEDMSMQGLRRYLAENPGKMKEILAHNESYVFFRFVENGPLGSLEVPVTAGRTLATDSRLFPKGALAFIVTRRPVLDDAGRLSGWRPFSRFVLNQDTGGAIRGLQRADLYFGTGDRAGAAAGYMNSMGKLYFPLLKTRHVRPR